MARRLHDGISELRKAAIKRLADAKRLLETLESRHARGAGYLAGYAIECKLKSIAMEIYNCTTLEALARRWRVDDRDVYTHGLEVLAGRLPSSNRFRMSEVWKDFAEQVNQWRPSWRYDPKDWEYERAKTFMKAVDRVYHWLDANN